MKMRFKVKVKQLINSFHSKKLFFKIFFYFPFESVSRFQPAHFKEASGPYLLETAVCFLRVCVRFTLEQTTKSRADGGWRRFAW